MSAARPDALRPSPSSACSRVAIASSTLPSECLCLREVAEHVDDAGPSCAASAAVRCSPRRPPGPLRAPRFRGASSSSGCRAPPGASACARSSSSTRVRQRAALACHGRRLDELIDGPRLAGRLTVEQVRRDAIGLQSLVGQQASGAAVVERAPARRHARLDRLAHDRVREAQLARTQQVGAGELVLHHENALEGQLGEGGHVPWLRVVAEGDDGASERRPVGHRRHARVDRPGNRVGGECAHLGRALSRRPRSRKLARKRSHEPRVATCGLD